MTVYIDDMYVYPMGKFYQMKMSHMIADTDEELHAMAEKIGLKRRWFQGDHYDVTKGKRQEAIRLGAVPIALRTLAYMTFCRKVNGKLPPLHLVDIIWLRTQYKLSIRRAIAEKELMQKQQGKGWRGNAAKIRLRER